MSHCDERHVLTNLVKALGYIFYLQPPISGGLLVGEISRIAIDSWG